MDRRERGRVERVVEQQGDHLAIRRRVVWSEGGETRSEDQDVTLETGQFLALEEPENCRLNFK